MPRYKGKGKFSFRGVMAFAIGLVFIWLALNPEHFNKNVPPVFILIIMFISGAGLVYGGITSLWFVWQRSGLIGSKSSVPAEICVLEDDDSDRGSETVHVRIIGRCQALGVDRSGAVRKYVDGKIRWGEVWLNKTGMVQAIAISGEHFNTLIGGRAIPDDVFGKSGS